jgi:hypothetical protein
MQQSNRFQEDDTELIAYAMQRAKEGGSLQSVTQDLIKLRIPPEKAKSIATRRLSRQAGHLSPAGMYYLPVRIVSPGNRNGNYLVDILAGCSIRRPSLCDVWRNRSWCPRRPT